MKMVSLLMFGLAVIAILGLQVACEKPDTGPKLCVEGLLNVVLEQQRTQSSVDESVAGTDKETVDNLVATHEKLDALFLNSEVKKRVIAALRLYRAKDAEFLKTVVEPKGTFVVFFLRSESDLAGQPVDRRPGWRKALFRLEKKLDRWAVADLDYTVEKFGNKPFYNQAGE